jgi:hypothetical protein
MITVTNHLNKVKQHKNSDNFKILDNGALTVQPNCGYDPTAAYAPGQWMDVVKQETPIPDNILDLDLLALSVGDLYLTDYEFDELRRRATMDRLEKNGVVSYLWNDRKIHRIVDRLYTEELIFRSQVLANRPKEETK